MGFTLKGWHRTLLWSLTTVLCLVIAGVTFWWCLKHPAIGFMSSHKNARNLSVLALLLSSLLFLARKCQIPLDFPWRLQFHPNQETVKRAAFKVLVAVLLASCIFGVFNYFKFRKEMVTEVGDYMDVVYYYTNSKYFEELGHFDLYPAILIADKESRNRLRNVRYFRDLYTYKQVRREEAFAPDRIESIKSNFTPERWEEFKHDVDFLIDKYSNWSYLLADRGYNPPATWTLVGGTLSGNTPIEHMKWITMIDFGLIVLTFLVIARAYGLTTMLLCLLWFTVTFSGRWPILGQALLRFDWVAALVMSVCMLKLKRTALSGALLTYATLSRVFPILFFIPYFFLVLRDTMRERRVRSEYWRFAAGAAIVFTLLTTGTLIRLGPDSFVETVKNLSIHAKSYSSHRTGLGDALVYEGEKEAKDLKENGGITTKKERVNELRPLLNIITFASIALIAVFIFRTDYPAHMLVPLASLPLFCYANAQTNYYNFRLILILLHMACIGMHRNKIGLLLLFLTAAATQHVMTIADTRYLVTTAMSFSMLAYFVLMVLFMVFDIFWGPAKATLEPVQSEARLLADSDGRLQRRLAFGLLSLALACFAFLLLRTAWLCDDAYITFRTVDNFINGFGLRWNIGERVQSYTHPLWMLLMAAVYFFTRESFLSGIFLSFFLSVTAVGVAIFGLSKNWAVGILAIFTLMFSRAFVDYSSSGLENPLTHFLLALFLLVFFQGKNNHKKLFLLSLIAALGVLNRMDTLLLYAPALCFVWWPMHSRKSLVIGALGFAPFVLWEFFSVIYYGFPFPNTAYAKLGNGIESREIIRQGLAYFDYTLNHDALTLIVIVLALISPFFTLKKNYLPLVLGICLYLLYTIKIGGGFMAGRFFAAPFFISVVMLARLYTRGPALAWLPAFIFVGLIGVAQPHAPIFTTPDYGIHKDKFEGGIANERMYYFQVSSLAKRPHGKEWPKNKYADSGRKYRMLDKELTKVHGSMGFRGFFGGPKLHLIDYYGLTDPILSRLPAKYDVNWRIGHFRRTIPKGYPESIEKKTNLIADENLHQFYEHMHSITSDPLWSLERCKNIINMNLGRYDKLIDWDTYRFPNMGHTTLQALAEEKPDGTAWNAPGTAPLSVNGLNISLPEIQRSTLFDISLDHNDKYQMLFMREKEVVGKLTFFPARTTRPGLIGYKDVLTPKQVVQEGFDAIRFFPAQGDKRYSIGHLRLHD